MAKLVADEGDPNMAHGGVAVSLAVLAGIAASDAACCAALGERSRSENHHDAGGLLSEITPGGVEAARDLRELINLKDAAHYGFVSASPNELKRALRRAEGLIDFAEHVLRR